VSGKQGGYSAWSPADDGDTCATGTQWTPPLADIRTATKSYLHSWGMSFRIGSVGLVTMGGHGNDLIVPQDPKALQVI
jgi:hypothetical protein